MKNILVVGGCGFIGHNVVKILQPDHRVATYDNYTDYGIIDRDEMDLLLFERFKIINGAKRFPGDIRTMLKLEQAFFDWNPEIVIHLASFPRGKVVDANPTVGADVMMVGLMNLLVCSRQAGVKRFVYVSSSMVYGNFTDGVTEIEPCYPKGIYATLKYCGELLVKDFCLNNGIEYVIVRPSAVYGPVDVDDRVIAKFFTAAIEHQPINVNGPHEKLDFTYVTDAAEGICLASLVEIAANNIYNITRGVGVPLVEAASLINVLTQTTSPIKINDRDQSFPSRGALSINKARTELGYNPQISIEEGFKLYYDWLLQN